MKNVQYMCHICDAQLPEHWGKERNKNGKLNNKLGFSHSEVMICLLHINERITEQLSISLNNEEQNLNQIQRILNADRVLQNVNLLTFNDEDNNDARIYLTNNQAFYLIDNYYNLFYKQLKVNKNLKEAWDTYKYIIYDLYKGVKDVSTLKTKCNNFFQLMKIISKVNWYIHYLKYHVELLVYSTNYKLNNISNEGLENTHKIIQKNR